MPCCNSLTSAIVAGVFYACSWAVIEKAWLMAFFLLLKGFGLVVVLALTA